MESKHCHPLIPWSVYITSSSCPLIGMNPCEAAHMFCPFPPYATHCLGYMFMSAAIFPKQIEYFTLGGKLLSQFSSFCNRLAVLHPAVMLVESDLLSFCVAEINIKRKKNVLSNVPDEKKTIVFSQGSQLLQGEGAVASDKESLKRTPVEVKYLRICPKGLLPKVEMLIDELR